MQRQRLILILTALSAFLLTIAPRPAYAQPPAAPAMDVVQRDAAIMLQESDRMVRTLRTLPAPLSAEQEEALRRFIDLNVAAQRFNDVLRADPGDPILTREAFQDMWTTYRFARSYFETMHQTDPMANEAEAARQAMLRLINFYKLETSSEKLINRPALVDAAISIESLAARLAERAHSEANAGRVSAQDAGQLDAVAAAARRFAARASAVQGAPEPLHRDYQALVDSLIAARARLASFTMNTQGEYGELWNLTQSINFLSPEASVGGFAYESRPVYKP